MNYVLQLLFALLLASGGWLFTRNMLRIRKLILAGRKEDFSDQSSLRWKNVFLLALGQKKMFKNIPVALMHLVVYAGFIIVNIEVLEIVLDGLLGTHRILLPLLGSSFYSFLIHCFEALALLVLVVCAIFLIRRTVLKRQRFA